eukprot:6198888-Pleurochrysis_carterae.AAC.1
MYSQREMMTDSAVCASVTYAASHASRLLLRSSPSSHHSGSGMACRSTRSAAAAQAGGTADRGDDGDRARAEGCGLGGEPNSEGGGGEGGAGDDGMPRVKVRISSA